MSRATATGRSIYANIVQYLQGVHISIQAFIFTLLLLFLASKAVSYRRGLQVLQPCLFQVPRQILTLHFFEGSKLLARASCSLSPNVKLTWCSISNDVVEPWH